MLGPNGDSNGCVLVKDYDAFLRAYENGQIKRLMVVASANQVVASAEPQSGSSPEGQLLSSKPVRRRQAQ